ncbi:hypothetical protein DPMN_017825 [Dreissena polymorpha]|uniref:AIG1-type G domain-containing protein n=1 Tax=Dreissena polymorpha TaxID=45954 RepID=A0A9D4NE12_DREPO|nr:hypothetical protein DPMN_017825 [Dreissena polymorpha]
MNDESVIKQIAQCVGLTLPGFNAICLVLQPGRFSMEMVKTVDIFLKFFGKGVDEYAFLILTHMASEEDMIEYINAGDKKPGDKGHKSFIKLRQRCKDKILFIDNKAKKYPKEEMVWKILAAVDKANAKAPKPYFQNKLTKEIQQRATDFYLSQVCGNGSERAKEGNNFHFC